ncbi:Hypothetical predicted protein [Cloeon dipterum]|uniref:Uncharacterized protein n=1 Tax=Cloeon dipterum TaxID=197152 RepID=A0A8S1E8M2_9INSE|nr:Hypothetical predicted protein [Cloeon dipterum]
MQDELQLMTKKRLQNLRRRSLGLQQLAVREISKQLTFYRTHPDELEKLKSLPGVLRDKILQVLMRKRCLDVQEQEIEFENLKEIFPLLLSPRTRYIELNGILSFCPDRYKNGKIVKVTQWCVELLKQIEARAPQVETLIINRNNPFDTEGVYNYLGNAELNQEMVQSLMKMQKLNRLNVNLYSIHLIDLLKICKNLLSLQYMNVDLSYPSRCQDMPTTEEVLSSFSNLKEFIFEIPCFEWLGCLCTRNLPNIEVVQFDPNKKLIRTIVRRNGNRYQGLDYPGTSNMRHITVDLLLDKAEEIKEMTKLFPKVSCLMIRNTGCLEQNVMPKFDNIRQLHLLNSFDNGVIVKYLIIYGKNLHSIYLGNDFENSTIDLEMIFKYCPKLEKLSLLNVCLNTPSQKMEFFAELKELEWVFHFYDSSSFGRSGRPDLQIMLLSNILSAPKLEKVKKSYFK